MQIMVRLWLLPLNLINMRKQTLKTESDFAETFAQITWHYVNKEKYPHLNADDLKYLEEIFYAHLEDRLISSILTHADQDLITMYEFLNKERKEESDEPIFDYDAFDNLMRLMMNDEVLKQKVEDDIAKYAEDFAKVAHRYLA